VDRNYYDADSLRAVLRFLEDQYGMSSDDFYAAHLADEGLPERLSGFNRHVWASMYREAQAHAGGSFAAQAEHVLAVAG